ncbi:MAG: carbohydrate kinase family protein [Candidatus Thorarchaeota archaeon]
MYDLAVIGCPSFDWITHNSVKRAGRALSGPAFTTALTTSKLGTEQMVLIGSISSDYETQFVNEFNNYGIPEYFIVDSPETGGFDIECYDDKEPVITGVLGLPKSIGIREIPEEFLSARIIALCPLLQEVDAELVEWICNSSDAQILLDPQLRTVDENRELSVISELFVASKTRSFIDYIIPSEHDAFLITGESDPFVAAEIIVDSIADHCIITLNSQGCLLFDGKKFSIIPSQSAKVCDLMDASSAFLGGFAYGLLNDYTPASCAALGTSVVTFMTPEDRPDIRMNRSEVMQRADAIALDIETR